ncbi:MAG: serine/threonine protein kinase [Phycisphaerae bacterium]|nr:serine/threonine protein kinase [Phycisphaerae bacterium]
MRPERWQRVRECFEAVVDAPAEQRDALLERLCAGDSELRLEVERLVGQDARQGLAVHPRGEGRRGESQEGDRVGAYRLVGEIGRGGMSTVWLAERADDEFRGRAAVKFIRGDLDAAQTLRRFRLERQVLANLRHPNISRLLDAGATADGRPYLIMEHVEGIPIDEFCERRALPTRDRVALFIRVCAAVHFAHQNLVVHRDLKPANILVGEDGEPTLLDFGIAKMLAPDATGDLTLGSAGPMTPRFASPEQFRGVPLSTASDVYSLGVVLYELLSGEAPYRLEPDATWEELARAICETEPPAPSVAARRRAGRPAVVLRGDLDTIVLKAMHKEPGRRYSSAEQMASDLRRHLDGMPVLARPDTIGYRATKFVRRNRVAVGLTAAVFVLLAALAVVATVQSVRVAQRQRLADARAAQTQQVASFQASMLLGSDAEMLGRTMLEAFRGQMATGLSSRAVIGPDGSVRRRTADEVAAEIGTFDAAITHGDATEAGKAVMDRVILAPALKALAGQFGDQPEVEARLRFTIGSVYNSYGLRDAAEPQLRRALELQQRHLGEKSPEVASTLVELVLISRARRDFGLAEHRAAEALAIRRATEPAGSLLLAQAVDHYGVALLDSGQLDAAEVALREGVEIYRRNPNETGENLSRSLGNLAGVMLNRRDAAAAEALMNEAIAIVRKRGQTARLAMLLNNLAGVRQGLDNLPGAVSCLQEAAAIQSRVLGETHESTLVTMGNLAGLLSIQKKYAEAEPLARFVLEGRLRTMAPHHFVVTVSRVVLADILIATDRSAEAEALLVAAWDAAKRDPGFSPEQKARFVRRLVDVENALGRSELADRYARESMSLDQGR